MRALKYIDVELLLTVGMAFAAENIINMFFSLVFSGFWPELVGWIAFLIVITYLTAEEAEDEHHEEQT